MPKQSEWRFCDKCTGMFFNGYSTKGHCPAGGAHHASGFDFFLTRDVPVTLNTQKDWRFCEKCMVMFFNGYPTKGHCAAGGAHFAQGFLFVLAHDVRETPIAQANWRFCDKCMAMFFNGRPDKGHCPAGGAHNAQGFNFVLPHDLPERLIHDNPELGDPTGKGEHPDPPNDPGPETGPTQNPDNQLPGEGPGCFIGSTQVLMADGRTKRIDAVAIGDRVTAGNEFTGHVDVGVVDYVFLHHVAKTLLLEVDGGEIIETTAEHRFACEGRGFVGAGDLQAEDRLTTHAGKTSRVLSTQPRHAEATVYNLSVAHLHTFYIGDATVWVHNVKKNNPDELPPLAP